MMIDGLISVLWIVLKIAGAFVAVIIAVYLLAKITAMGWYRGVQAIEELEKEKHGEEQKKEEAGVNREKAC